MKHTAAMLLLLSVGWFTSPLLPTRNTVEPNHKLYKDGLQILDEIVLRRKSSGGL
jgi:hypothetical protein